jgi:NAD(P)-dependent dehydrogenase (short-subunit alcohol dehydrogenase family)
MWLDGRTAVVTGGAAASAGLAWSAWPRGCRAWVVLDRDADRRRDGRERRSATARSIAIDLSDLAAIDALDCRSGHHREQRRHQHVAPIEQFPPRRSR